MSEQPSPGVVGVDGFYGIPYEGGSMQWIPYDQWIENPGGSKYRIEKPKARRPRPVEVQPTPPSPVPPTPSPTTDQSKTTAVKQATPDIIIFDEEIDPNFLTQAFFEEFGGTELINISRHDLINGDQVSYTPIYNLNFVKQSFNSNNIIGISPFQDNDTRYGIDLISRGVHEPVFDENGNLIIEIDEIRKDESIEVEISTSGTINVIEL